MAEEQHRCEAQEGHRLCANNCGLFGSSTTLNLCSKCYTDLRLQPPSLSSSSSSTATTATVSSPIAAVTALPEKVVEIPVAGVDDVAKGGKPSRCWTCRKRVGLIKFKCRCGTTLCGAHRYPEMHGCGFDFKKVGREEIARANPLVKADKLQRI